MTDPNHPTWVSLGALRGVLTRDDFDMGVFLDAETKNVPIGNRWGFLVATLRATLTRHALLVREWTELLPAELPDLAPVVAMHHHYLIGRDSSASTITRVAAKLLCVTEAAIDTGGRYGREQLEFNSALKGEFRRSDIEEGEWPLALAVLVVAATVQHACRIVMLAEHGVVEVGSTMELYAAAEGGNPEGPL